MCQVGEWLLDCLDFEEDSNIFPRNVGKLKLYTAEDKKLELDR